MGMSCVSCVTGRAMGTSCICVVLQGRLWVHQCIMGMSHVSCVTGRVMGISAYNGYIII